MSPPPLPELCARLDARPLLGVTMIVTRLGRTPNICAMVSAVMACPADNHAADTTTVTLALQLNTATTGRSYCVCMCVLTTAGVIATQGTLLLGGIYNQQTRDQCSA